MPTRSGRDDVPRAEPLGQRDGNLVWPAVHLGPNPFEFRTKRFDIATRGHGKKTRPLAKRAGDAIEGYPPTVERYEVGRRANELGRWSGKHHARKKDEGRAALGARGDRLADPLDAVRIEAFERVLEHEDGRLGDDGVRERNQPPLNEGEAPSRTGRKRGRKNAAKTELGASTSVRRAQTREPGTPLERASHREPVWLRRIREGKTDRLAMRPLRDVTSRERKRSGGNARAARRGGRRRPGQKDPEKRADIPGENDAVPAGRERQGIERDDTIDEHTRAIRTDERRV
jgi:hypothetical protein